MARILLDNCVHIGFAKLITGHSVSHVVGLGWQQFSDAELLDAAIGLFDVIVTLDKSLRFQQPKRIRQFVVIVLRARSSQLRDLQPLARRTLAAMATATIGDAVEISAP